MHDAAASEPAAVIPAAEAPVADAQAAEVSEHASEYSKEVL